MSKKILLVDDDPLVHRLLEHFLKAASCEVLHAHGGLEALKIIETESVDLIVMDIMMDDQDGITTLREIRKKHPAKNIPVIVITSNIAANKVYQEEAKLAGAAGFLTKPFGPQQLISEIERVTAKES
jgi:two-component system chemotaxis response regulator CheY